MEPVDHSKATKEDLEKAKSIAGMYNLPAMYRLMHDVRNSFYKFDGEDRRILQDKFRAAYAVIQKMEPRDPLEAQLIVQIVCTHNIAAEAMRRANMPDASEDTYNRALHQSRKFLKLFQEQMLTLIKYRQSATYRLNNAPKKLIVRFVDNDKRPIDVPGYEYTEEEREQMNRAQANNERTE